MNYKKLFLPDYIFVLLTIQDVNTPLRNYHTQQNAAIKPLEIVSIIR